MSLNRRYLYLSLSSYTLLTKPHSLASEAIIFLAVNASSRTRLSLPITRGNLCRVPTSAAIPIEMKVIYVTNFSRHKKSTTFFASNVMQITSISCLPQFISTVLYYKYISDLLTYYHSPRPSHLPLLHLSAT